MQAAVTKVPYTGRNLFLTVLEAEKSKIKALTDSVSGETLFLIHRQLSFHLCPPMAGGIREVSQASFLSTLIPFMWAPPS